MLGRVMDMGTGVYVLWGLGILGLLLKMIANTYLRGMLRASENMATTKKRRLRIIRQKYENGRSLGINGGSGEAYAEKSIRGLRLLAMPLEFWRRSGQALAGVTCMTMAGAFIYYDVSWRGSPAMVTYLANGTAVCAFLLVLENIFLINNKVEMLKANIRDYLENLTPVRASSPRAPARPYLRAVPDTKAMPDMTGKVTGSASDREGRSDRNIPVKDESAVTSVYDERASNSGSGEEAHDNEAVLNSFLKEFFS